MQYYVISSVHVLHFSKGCHALSFLEMKNVSCPFSEVKSALCSFPAISTATQQERCIPAKNHKILLERCVCRENSCTQRNKILCQNAILFLDEKTLNKSSK